MLPRIYCFVCGFFKWEKPKGFSLFSFSSTTRVPSPSRWPISLSFSLAAHQPTVSFLPLASLLYDRDSIADLPSLRSSGA